MHDQKKITDFSIHEYLHLTESEVNFVCDVWEFLMLCWSNLKQSQNYKHLVLRLFQVWLHIIYRYMYPVIASLFSI